MRELLAQPTEEKETASNGDRPRFSRCGLPVPVEKGVYTQASNRRHGRTGHLFQERFKGILVDKDAYLLDLSRYVVLNPLRANMVKAPEDWRWKAKGASLALGE